MTKKKHTAPSTPRADGSPRFPPGSRRQVNAIIKALDALYPDVNPTLRFDNRVQLLVATILSAQTTDAQVNRVTPVLFKRYPTAEDFARADLKSLESLIRTVGFFRRKAVLIRDASRALVERHGGEVPSSIDALTALPGVGRKTANVVLCHGFGVNEGVTVDTHVRRLAQRLGLTKHTDPKKIEVDLMAALPKKHWNRIAHQLIEHGRAVCRSRKPACNACRIAPYCPSCERDSD